MNERIKVILDCLHLSASEMATRLSVQRSTFSHLLSGRNKPSFDFIQSLLREFPEVNPDYLILGKGKWHRLKEDIQGTPKTVSDDKKVEANTELLEPITPAPMKESKKLSEYSTNNVGDHVNNVVPLVQIVHYYSDGSFKSFYPRE